MTPPLYPAEAVMVRTSTFYVTLDFLAPGTKEVLCSVSIPIPIAKEVSLILRKHMVEYEQKAGTEIILSPDVYKSLGISRGDWPLLPDVD